MSLDLVNCNALRIIELAGRKEVKVFGGCSKPIIRTPLYANHVHGDTGLDGAELPPATSVLQRQHAVDFIIDSLLSSHEKMTISCSGPMTNLAIALVKEPSIVSKIERVKAQPGREISLPLPSLISSSTHMPLTLYSPRLSQSQ